MVDEKGKFIREVEGKYKVIFKFIENHQEISKSFSYMNRKGKWQMFFGTIPFSVF